MASESGSPTIIQEQKLLLGEGQDELNFFRAFLSHLSIDDIQVIEYGGKSKLRDFLESVLVKAPGFREVESIGVTRDADEDPQAAFNSVVGGLENAGLDTPDESGSIVQGNPDVGVLILPPDESPGMLEDMFLHSLSNAPVLSCMEKFMKCCSSNGLTVSNESKAMVHAFLAVQDPLRKNLGLAAQHGHVSFEDPAFKPLVEFVTSL